MGFCDKLAARALIGHQKPLLELSAMILMIDKGDDSHRRCLIQVIGLQELTVARGGSRYVLAADSSSLGHQEVLVPDDISSAR